MIFGFILIAAFSAIGWVLSCTFEVALGIEQAQGAWAWIGLSVASIWLVASVGIMWAVKFTLEQNRIQIRLDFTDPRTAKSGHVETMGRVIPIN